MTNYQKEGKVFYLKENYDKALDYYYKALKKQEASDILLYNDMPKVNTSGKIDATAGNNVKNCTLFYQSLVCAFARQKAIGTKVADNALLPGATVNIYSVYGRKIQKGAYGYLVYDKAS